MSDDGELPNLGLLIKLMKMTTSAVDAEALLAVRKANEQLKKFGGDWEALLSGKVTVIGDPFVSEVPTAPPARPMSSQGQAKRRVQPTPRPFQRGAAGRGNSGWQATFTPPKPPPPPPSPPPKAPPGPVTFAKIGERNGKPLWGIKSPTTLSEGKRTDIRKSSGDIVQEFVGTYIKQDQHGYFLYNIGKASKYRQRYADTPNIDDLFL